MDIDAHIKLIGDLLVSKEMISQEEFDEIKANFKKEPDALSKNFEDYLIGNKIISEKKLLRVYSEQFDIPLIDLDATTVDAPLLSLVPAKFAIQNIVIPIEKDEGTLTVAIRDPLNINIVDEIKAFTQLKIKTVLCAKEDIQASIKVHYGTGAATVEKLVQDKKEATSSEEDQTGLDEAGELGPESSMVNYVNQLLMEAYTERATDIHIEPFQNRLRIRYRVDGVLQEAKTPKDIMKLHASIISRLKVMAHLNISERRAPQDGRAKVVLNGRELDLRLSTFPTLYGEGLSIRMLDASSILIGIDHLNFEEEHRAKMVELLKKPNGIILVTGPTGSGKTTTLYACIHHINDEKIRIVTLEDPIEYQLDGVNQIQTNPKVGLTFANGFRSILRQDPDVILVGEIRDTETAEIAIRAALTGHLILSTLHTNNAMASIARLLDLKIEPYLLTNTLKAVIAQRLVRKICESCKVSHQTDKKMLKALGIDSPSNSFFRGKGCDACNQTGYMGRMAIFELLTLDDKLTALIAQGDPKGELRKQAEIIGMATLREDGIKKAQQGLTTIEEVIRVTE